MNTEQLWTGNFGNEYTARQSADITARYEMWKIMLPRGIESALEVGANVGLNLDVIQQLTGAELFAAEPNDEAREELKKSGLMPDNNIVRSYAHKLAFGDDQADLAFTCGVLIHIAPDKLLASMKEIHRVAKRWIICGEYFSPKEEMVPYRGHDNQLWKRDYGSIWLDNFPDLHCHSCLFAWRRMTGLDNLTFWLFEKGQMRQ